MKPKYNLLFVSVCVGDQKSYSLRSLKSPSRGVFIKYCIVKVSISCYLDKPKQITIFDVSWKER